MSSVLIFDNKGKFIRKIGHAGRGPQEYVWLNSFDVDSQFVYLNDMNKNKILKFDINGKFISSQKIEFNIDSFKKLDNNNFLVSINKHRTLDKLIITNHNFKIYEVLLTYDPLFIDNGSFNNILRRVDNKIIYHKPVSDTIYCFNNKGVFIKSYTIDFGSMKVPKKSRILTKL